MGSMGRRTGAIALLLFLAITFQAKPLQALDLAPSNSATGNLAGDGDQVLDRPSAENVLMNRKIIERDFPDQKSPQMIEFAAQDKVLQQFAKIDPKRIVPKDLLATTLAFFAKNKAKFKNQDYITIVDFGSYSAKARLFIVPMNGADAQVFHTTHGVGSDPKGTGTPQVFGNVDMSGMSSIGFFRSGETYSGQYGYALRIDGLSTTNSNVRMRAVVFHGWKKAMEKDVKQPMSHGCFAFDFAVRDEIVNKVKNGSLIYANVSNEH